MMEEEDDKMKITKELVQYVAQLSRLKLQAEDVEPMTAQLEQIIGYIGVLEGLDTTEVEGQDHILELKNVLREDTLCPSLDREALLKSAPASDGEAFLVPRAVD